MTITVSGIRKTYRPVGRGGAEVLALDALDLEVAPGELLVVVGPSGSGKTTLLRIVAGLEEPDSGVVKVGGIDVTALAPGTRDVAMVFQEYALFPHMTVAGNIGFGLHARGAPRAEIADKVARVAAMLELQTVLARKPGELSGGERQRVALARAVVREPRAFLMDEPLSNLDAELRAQTRAEIRSLQRRLGVTTMYVTHDQVEAMTMGQRVAVLRAGRLEQVDDPVTLYERPASLFVARFMGSPPMNLVAAAALGRSPDGVDTVGVRPEKVRLVAARAARLAGEVIAVEPIGNETLVHLEVAGAPFVVRVDPSDAPAGGGTAGVDFDDAALHHFDASGRRLER
ncbi:MAG: ABC transporter ATP-binding protein [Actinomycetota bacterium]